MDIPEADNSPKPELSVNDRLGIATEFITSQGGTITYEQFMGLSMYGEGLASDLADSFGYYTSGRARIHGGDFTTAPEMTSLFGVLTTRRLANIWDTQGKPDRFDIVEMGGGNGVWARDILQELEYLDRAGTFPGIADSIKYKLVEISPALAARQQVTLEEAGLSSKASWVYGSALDLPDDLQVSGAFISNELIDTFPTHRVAKHGGKLLEIVVKTQGGKLLEDVQELENPSIDSYLEQADQEIPEGGTVNINLRALQWLDGVALHLESGHVLTIDYGSNRLPSELRFFPDRIHAPQLQYSEPGSFDITSDVDFSALASQGVASGLATVNFAGQATYFNLPRTANGENASRIDNLITGDHWTKSGPRSIKIGINKAVELAGLDCYVLEQKKQLAVVTATANFTASFA